MTDWSDEIAMNFAGRHPVELANRLRKLAADKEAEFAIRERKAKADGVRQLGEIWSLVGEKFNTGVLLPMDLKEAIEIANVLADKIERGEA